MSLGFHEPRASLEERGNARPLSARSRAPRRRLVGGGQTGRSHAINLARSVVPPPIIAEVEQVEVVVAHHERAPLRVGDVFL